MVDNPYFHVFAKDDIPYDLATYLKPASSQRPLFSPSHYKCLPLTAANTLGWTLYNPFEFTVTWTGTPDVDSVQVEVEQAKWVRSWFGFGTFTIHPFFLVETSPGIDLLIRPVPNHIKFGVMAFDGIVETDWLHAGFTINFRMQIPMMKAHFAVGDPLVQFVPYPRDFIERIETGIYRKGERYQRRIDAYNVFRSKRHAQVETTGKPQFDYMRGLQHDGSVFTEHKKVFRLKPFEEKNDEEQNEVTSDE